MSVAGMIRVTCVILLCLCMMGVVRHCVSLMVFVYSFDPAAGENFS
jgi:hypothetical protein